MDKRLNYFDNPLIPCEFKLEALPFIILGKSDTLECVDLGLLPLALGLRSRAIF